MSDENKSLMDKSMLERYRKYKCCVFIDFEHIYKDYNQQRFHYVHSSK